MRDAGRCTCVVVAVPGTFCERHVACSDTQGFVYGVLDTCCVGVLSVPGDDMGVAVDQINEQVGVRRAVDVVAACALVSTSPQANVFVAAVCSRAARVRTRH